MKETARNTDDLLNRLTMCYTFLNPLQCKPHAAIRKVNQAGKKHFKEAFKKVEWDSNVCVVAVEDLEQEDKKMHTLSEIINMKATEVNNHTLSILQMWNECRNNPLNCVTFLCNPILECRKCPLKICPFYATLYWNGENTYVNSLSYSVRKEVPDDLDFGNYN